MVAESAEFTKAAAEVQNLKQKPSLDQQKEVSHKEISNTIFGC